MLMFSQQKFCHCILISFLIISFASASDCKAGKRKSASNSLENITKAAKHVEQDLEELKSVTDSIAETGSFITSDFWKTTPRWYRTKEGNGITTKYPFDSYGYFQDLPKNLYQRKIRNVALSPKKIGNTGSEPQDWKESFNLDFSEFFSRRGHYGNKRSLIIYFKEQGLPENQLEPAFNFYTTHFFAITPILTEGIVNKFDALYENNVLIGVEQIWKGKKQISSLFGEHINVPTEHKKIVDNSVQMLSVENWPNMVGCRDRNGELLTSTECFLEKNGIMKLDVQVVSYTFQVAKDNDATVRKSQLIDLGYILDETVQSGKAVTSNRGKMNIYQDANIPGSYRGRFEINLKSGNGVWRIPIWEARDDMKKISSKLYGHQKELNKQIKKYLDAALSEAVRKFGTQNIGMDNDQSAF